MKAFAAMKDFVLWTYLLILSVAVVGVVVGFAVINPYGGAVLIDLAPSSPYGYAFKYKVSPNLVSIEKYPHNCEWGTAPLGDKNCHYVASVAFTTLVGVRDPLLDSRVTPSMREYREARSVIVSWTKVED